MRGIAKLVAVVWVTAMGPGCTFDVDYRPGQSDNQAGDASSDADAMQPGSDDLCSGQLLDYDPFDVFRDIAWINYTDGTGNIDVVAGIARAVVGPASRTGLVSKQSYTTDGLQVTVEVFPSSDSPPSPWVDLSLIDSVSSDMLLRLLHQDDSLRATWRSASGEDIHIAQLAYESAAHRWWRVSVREGIFRWQVSADGFSFSDLAEQTPDMTPTGEVKLRFNVEGSSDESSVGQNFDDFVICSVGS